MRPRREVDLTGGGGATGRIQLGKGVPIVLQMLLLLLLLDMVVVVVVMLLLLLVCELGWGHSRRVTASLRV